MTRRRGVIESAEVYAELQGRFEQWRSTQPLRSRLPESLWESAVELAREHGVNPTAGPGFGLQRAEEEVNGNSRRPEQACAG